MSIMFCSTFINDELSREDFIKAIHKYNANLAAPLKYVVSPDDCGCQPAIYDDQEVFKKRQKR